MRACQRCGYPLAHDGRCDWCAGLARAAAAFGTPWPAMDEPGPDLDPARLTGKVLGFRHWHLDGYKLTSGAGEWTMGVNTAECKREVFEGYGLGSMSPALHEAPDHHCTCGLYAWYHPMGLLPDLVAGAVLASGRIEAHPTGFRAQYAEPVVLAYDDAQPYRLVVDLKAIAGEMGLECVPLAELESEAAKHGKPIPEDLRLSYPGFAIPPTALARRSRLMAGASVGALPPTVLPSPFTPHVIPPAPAQPKPTWGARVPLVIIAFCVGLTIALGAIDGEWWLHGPTAVWCAAMLGICLRFYRRRYRRPT